MYIFTVCGKSVEKRDVLVFQNEKKRVEARIVGRRSDSVVFRVLN